MLVQTDHVVTREKDTVRRDSKDEGKMWKGRTGEERKWICSGRQYLIMVSIVWRNQ